MSQIKTKPFDSQRYTPPSRKKKNKNKGKNKGKGKGKNKGKNKGRGKGKGRSHRHGGARKRKRLTYGEVRVCKLECVSLRSKLMTFDLHPPQVSNSYSTAQLQCDTGSKEAEVKIRKMLNKHMVGPKDSDSLLSVLLATPTAKTPSAQLQCDTGSKEAEVKIRKMLNKHMVGPKDSDSLLSVLLATPTAKTPSVEKFLSHCRYMRHKWARTM